MYKEDQRFDRPDDKAKIWRYMDLAKLVWMLDKQCLYFCNIASFAEADRFEASYLPMGFLRELPSDAAKNFAEKMKSCGPPLTVNCWHLNNFESAAMWKLYSETNKGIAIQSTFGALVGAFHGFPDDVHIGKIRYIDYCKDRFKGESPEIFEPVMTKRKSFEHEKELRAVIWETSDPAARTDDGSVLASVDVKALVKGIFLSPGSPLWVKDVIESVAGKYGIQAPVKLSQLDEEPLY